MKSMSSESPKSVRWGTRLPSHEVLVSQRHVTHNLPKDAAANSNVTFLGPPLTAPVHWHHTLLCWGKKKKILDIYSSNFPTFNLHCLSLFLTAKQQSYLSLKLNSPLIHFLKFYYEQFKAYSSYPSSPLTLTLTTALWRCHRLSLGKSICSSILSMCLMHVYSTMLYTETTETKCQFSEH